MWFSKTAEVKDGIDISLAPEDIPKFKRTYVVRINDSVKLTIEMYTWAMGRMTHGELTQPNGSWVMFEPERPADKILDRDILPIVEQRCRQILALDAEYVRSNPSEFADEKGGKWTRSQ